MTAQAQPKMNFSIFMTLLGLSIAYAVTAVDPLLFTLNLTEITKGLGIPPDLVGFTGGAATLVVAAAVLGVGNLGDIYGLKRLLIYGFVSSIVFEALSALSPSYRFLIVMRFLDGLALAALLGLSLALLSVSVPEQVRPVAIGFYIAINAIFYGVTPIIGGWVVQTFGWRAMFLIVVPVAVAGLLLTIKFVAEPPRKEGRKLDVVGIVLFGVALVGFVYGIGETLNGFTDPRTWIPLTISIVAFIAFVWWERRQDEPALDLSLFGQPAFVVAGLATVSCDFLMGGYGVVLGQFGTAVLGLSAAAIGLFYLPGTLIASAAAILAGYLISKYGARLVLIWGMLILAASSAVMATSASPTMSLWILVLATFLNTLGANITSTPASDIIVSHAPPERAGTVTAMKPAFSKLGYSLSPTIYVLLLEVFFMRGWLADTESRGLTDQQAQQALNVAKNASVGNSPSLAPYDPNLVERIVGVARMDFTEGLRITMLIVTLVPLVVAALAYFLIPRRPQSTPQPSPAVYQQES
jgi:MFS family permease